MNNYEIRVVPKIDEDGETYWTAFYPAIEGCVGGGVTAEEAISEAKENLEIYLEYLINEKIKIPNGYEEPKCNGKIALRVSKTTHKNITEMAANEGISINTFIICAIENYLGKKQYNYEIDAKIDELRKIAESSLKLQKLNAMINSKIANAPWGVSIFQK